MVEVVNDDADEEVKGEEGAEDDEDDEVDVHVDVALIIWLLVRLSKDRKDPSQFLGHRVADSSMPEPPALISLCVADKLGVISALPWSTHPSKALSPVG